MRRLMSCHKKTQKKTGGGKEGGWEIAAIWPPPSTLPLAFITVTPCYEDQSSSWSAEDQKWHPRHPVRTQRGLRGPVKLRPFDLSSAAKQISPPAMVSMFVSLFNYSKAPDHSELGIWLAGYGNCRLSPLSTSLLWEPLWKSTLPPSPADKSHYDDVDWMEKKTPHFYATKWQICFCAPNNLTATAGYKCVCAGLCVNYNDRLWGWGLIKYRGVWCIQPLCYPVSHFPSKIKKLCLLQNQRARKRGMHLSGLSV